jgi:hypothetical protein
MSEALTRSGAVRKVMRVALAGDLRTSTPHVLAANTGAGELRILECHTLGRGNGGHSPGDYNGIRFCRCAGKALRDGEACIESQSASLGVFQSR